MQVKLFPQPLAAKRQCSVLTAALPVVTVVAVFVGCHGGGADRGRCQCSGRLEGQHHRGSRPIQPLVSIAVGRRWRWPVEPQWQLGSAAGGLVGRGEISSVLACKISGGRSVLSMEDTRMHYCCGSSAISFPDSALVAACGSLLTRGMKLLQYSTLQYMGHTARP